jgi:Xaa-Pro aminopeptidase
MLLNGMPDGSEEGDAASTRTRYRRPVERVERARNRMAECGVDLLAVPPSDDLRYLVGFSPTPDERACMLLLGRDDAVFLVPSLNAAQSREALPTLRFVEWADEAGPETALREAIGPFAAARRTAVSATMRADFLLLLQSALSGSDFASADPVVGELRMRKDEGELATLQASAATADAAMTAALGACAAGVRERDVAEAAAAAFRTAGADEVSFTSVASGPNAAFPHHHSGERELRPGDAVTIDLGGLLGGYASDLTRVAHVGQLSERYRLVHETVEQAVQAALAAARPGATCADVDRAAREVIDRAGFGPYFVHRTGHGLGLTGHEPPSIMAGEQRELEPRMVFSIEPGIYLPGEFGVRLEEIVVTTESGCRILSTLERGVVTV